MRHGLTAPMRRVKHPNKMKREGINLSKINFLLICINNTFEKRSDCHFKNNLKRFFVLLRFYWDRNNKNEDVSIFDTPSFDIVLFAMDYFLLIAMSTVTATATVAPTIGLLPIPRNPIIST